MGKQSLGQVIKLKRVEKKMKSYELAEKANLSKTYLSDIENERITPSLSALYRISKVLGLKLEDLFAKSNFDEVGENKSA